MSSDNEYRYLSGQLKSYLAPLRNYRINVEGQEWKYLEGGSGDVVLFLHGLSSSKTQWRSIMRELVKSYRVIAIDVPGLCLYQPLLNKKHNLRELSAWLDLFLKQLDIEKTHIIAHSLSCPIAAFFAATRKQTVQSLSLIAFADVLLPGASGKIELWDTFKESVNFQSVEDIDLYFKDIYFKLPTMPAAVKKYNYNRFMQNKSLYLRVLDELAETMPEILTHLGQIECPVLTLTGDSDGWSSNQLQSSIKTHLPWGEHEVLENCGHMCYLEKPLATQKLCSEFLWKVTHSDTIIPLAKA